MDARRVFHRYTQRVGTAAVEPDRLHFWQVLALFNLGAIAIAAVRSFLDGGSDRAAQKPADFLRRAVLATEAA